MARAEPNRGRIGDMLVAAGLITAAQIDEALDAQQGSKLPLGKQLVALGHVTEHQLTQVLSHQLSVPWVSLDRIEFSEELLARVPGDIADRFSVMPIYIRHVRHQGATLYVAMDDPTQEEALRRVSMASGLPVKPMIAAPSDIRRAVEEHYFGAPPRSLPAAGRAPDERTSGVPERPSLELQEAAAEAGKAPRVRPPPPPARAPRADGAVPVEQYDVPSKPPAGQSKTVTLLDGTTISLPAPASGKRASQPVTEVRHVIKAVRAASADLGIEGAPRWHDVVQVLLEAIAARGIRLTRKEVAEAWAQHKQPSPKSE